MRVVKGHHHCVPSTTQRSEQASAGAETRGAVVDAALRCVERVKMTSDGSSRMAAHQNAGSAPVPHGAVHREFVVAESRCSQEACLVLDAPGNSARGDSKRMRRCCEAALPTSLTDSIMEAQCDASTSSRCHDADSQAVQQVGGLQHDNCQAPAHPVSSGTASMLGEGQHGSCSARPLAGAAGTEMARVKGLEKDNRQLKNDVMLLQLQVQLLRQIVSMSQGVIRVPSDDASSDTDEDGLCASPVLE